MVSVKMNGELGLFQLGTQFLEDLFFQAGYVGLRDAQELGHFILGQLPPSVQPEAKFNNVAFSLGEP